VIKFDSHEGAILALIVKEPPLAREKAGEAREAPELE
jgi:hypothetical protein